MAIYVQHFIAASRYGVVMPCFADVTKLWWRGRERKEPNLGLDVFIACIFKTTEFPVWKQVKRAGRNVLCIITGRLGYQSLYIIYLWENWYRGAMLSDCHAVCQPVLLYRAGIYFSISFTRGEAKQPSFSSLLSQFTSLKAPSKPVQLYRKHQDCTSCPHPAPHHSCFSRTSRVCARSPLPVGQP